MHGREFRAAQPRLGGQGDGQRFACRACVNVTHMRNVTHMSKETLLTTREAASRLGVSVQTISRWVSEEKLKPVLKAPGIRGSLFFSEEDVDALAGAA